MASGSWKKEENGTYTVVVDVGMNGVRKQKKKRGIKTKIAAEKLITKILSEVNTGTYLDQSKLPLSEYLEKWLETKNGNMSRLTVDAYKSYFANHVNPYIGHIKICDLTGDDIENLIVILREKESKGLLSDSTIQRVYSILRTALNAAVKKGLIKINPTKAVDRPKIKKRILNVWDASETKIFLKGVYNHLHYFCYHLALTTGMRQGEILGLTWANVDLVRKVIRVTQTLEHDGKGFKQGAKTISGIRSISISDMDVKEFERQLERIRIDKKLAGEVYQDNDLVICTKIGKPVFADTVGRIFRREVKRLELKPLRFHDQRHTHCTLLLLKGILPKIVSERMGHKSVIITMDTYGHLLPNMQETASDGISDLLFDT